MHLTAEQANLLLDSIETKEQLLDLIDKVDHRVQGSVTVLYSGVTGKYTSVGDKIVHSGAMAEALHESGNDVRTIDQSEIGRFMNMTKNSSGYNKKFADKLKQIFGDNKVELQSFMDGEVVDGMRVNNGVWDRVSARYVADAVGEVVTFTGGASLSRVFFQTELPLILSNPRVTSIDGIPIEVFDGMSLEDAFKIITAASEVRTSRLRISVDENGSPLQINQHYILDARDFFEDSKVIHGHAPPADTPMRSMADFIPQERVAAHREALREIRLAQDNLAVHYKQDLVNQPSVTPSRWLKAMDQLGHVADVVSLAAVAHEAKAAMDAGDPDTAQRIMTQWALENAGAILAGRLASLAVAPLLAAGPLGWLAASGLVLSASMLGSAYADEAAEFVAEHLADLWDRGLGALRNQFQEAERTYSCPLVLDLDRNGVITSAEHRSAIHFDHDSNGFAERTGWISPTDGLLVHDLDGNGLIDHGGELFGNNTWLPTGSKAANGFEALKALDDNGDRWIDHHDAAWSTLKVWIDRNSNAMTDQGEMVSLGEAGLFRLGVDYASSDIVDSHGNRHLQIGVFQASDLTLQSMHDVWFQVDQARTKWLNSVSIDADLSSLPNLHGMGQVPDLHQVMAVDASGELRSLLERWIQGNSLQREALIDPLIFRWVGVSSDRLSYGREAIDGRLAVMERLLGQIFRQGWVDQQPLGQATRMLHQAYEDFRLQLEHQLILQTDAWPILQRLVAADGDINVQLASQNLEWIANYLDASFLQTSDYLGMYKLARTFDSIGDPGKLILAKLRESVLFGSQTAGIVHRLFSEHRLQQGSADSNQLFGTAGQDFLDGGAGDDVLHGGAGRDWLVSGSGNDSLNGGIGDDVYVIGSGGERKEISDTDYEVGNRDVVQYQTLRSQDITTTERHGNHLILRDSGGGQLQVEHYFSSEAHRIEAFQFSNGVLWGDSHIRERVVVSGATAGNDTLGGFNDMANRIKGLDGHDLLYGGIQNDALTGGNGNDTLHGGDGDDILDGGAGHDVLHGGRGRDRLISGTGHDTLVGGEGDDTYVIVRSGATKTITDYDPNVTSKDMVTFSNLRSTDLVSTRKQGVHLEMRFSTRDQLVVSNYFLSRDYGIEAFRFSNGVTFGEAEILSLTPPV